MIEDVPRLHPLPEDMKHDFKTYEFRSPFIVDVHNGKIRGRHAAVISSHDQLLLESVLNHESVVERTSLGRIHFPTSLRQLIRQATVSPHFDGYVCPILNAWSRNFYHWLVENLSRLYYIERFTEITGQRPLLLIEPNPPQWMLDSLHLLGYTPSDYREWDVTYATADHIVVPILAYETGLPSPRACRWASARANQNLPDDTREFHSPNVYISRRLSTARRVINEEELMDFLAPYGFEMYALETMTFAEQVKLFSQAQFIIGPHGAGFVNMFHAIPGATVVEFFEPSFFNGCMYRLAQGLGFTYRNYFGESRGVDNRVGGFDIYVDIDQLKELITPLLPER